MMQLSEHFSLSELTRSDLAARLQIDNTPGPQEIACLKQLAENILEPVRKHYNKPFRPNSGYRCLALNRALKSKDSSQHVKGQAVDIEVPGVSNFDLAEWMYQNLQFDQLILECYKPGDPNSGWVHCSFVADQCRQECLTFSDGSFSQGLIG
ncbi:D-Ala-D-Ala carboxypeptidase family metallohydrolase [Sneathiella aquimaris]|uniref:D-Ala-D-Ala carboxypeptidase family metallohydrolase n=1 Tax=Sneathiella aquimaris TaxID=2599305 RepID=UPI00146BF9BF|nr:D-Ala-D-Ala carboxypeptidase family metallohydrolase [Sneathiella aquimaris]